MSVLIKGLEMPKSLGISISIYPDGRVVNYNGSGPKVIVGSAVQIPPHGRLIDADALMGEMESACMGVMSGCDSYNEPMKVLSGAPTIIEEERK